MDDELRGNYWLLADRRWLWAIPATANFCIMSFTCPIHRVASHPTSATLYLATSLSLHKYNLETSSVDATYIPQSGYTHLLEVSDQWLFLSGGSKILHVLNAHTLETVAELYACL
jgi:hypothetical protein